MKRVSVLFVVCLCLAATAMAQQVTFRFTDGIRDAALKTKMQTNISQLLTEINRAAAADLELQLDKMRMTPQARTALENLWRSSHFRCEYTENAQPCLTDIQGYEVRGIAVMMLSNSAMKNRLREVCINLSRQGEITSVHMALNNNIYRGQLDKSRNATDLRRKTEILSFVERFRSFYDEKDIDALRQIYSDDALIITGRVITHKKYKNDAPTLEKEVVYRRQNKEEYLNNLENTFKSNRYIHLTFDDIQIYGHKSKANFYGVSLKQKWDSTNYKDNGYLFLLWEFPDGDNEPPVIHVRTWQPEWIDNGKQLNPDDKFNINDFFIP